MCDACVAKCHTLGGKPELYDTISQISVADKRLDCDFGDCGGCGGRGFESRRLLFILKIRSWAAKGAALLEFMRSKPALRIFSEEKDG